MSRGLFRILGLIMVGPSSSHTAGAVRIGLVSRAVSKGKAVKVKFFLHGSFRNTYKGHGTDRALTAGILGLKTDDEKIIQALEIAKAKNLKVEFIKSDLGDVHPNTVRVVMSDTNGEETSVLASSIGGGEIRVHAINNLIMNSSCSYNTVIITHKKESDVLCKIFKLIRSKNLELVSLNLGDDEKTGQSVSILEFNSNSEEVKQFTDHLAELSAVKKVTNIEKI